MPKQAQTREQLLDGAVAYVLEAGLIDLSLRPMARATGTSARMLLYHFGSREQLLREVLARIREREGARIAGWQAEAPRSTADFLRWYWSQLEQPRARPAQALIFELYAMALRKPDEFPGVLEDPIAWWKKLVPKHDAALATLLLAATRGLSLDLAATGQRARVRGALELLCSLLEAR